MLKFCYYMFMNRPEKQKPNPEIPDSPAALFEPGLGAAPQGIDGAPHAEATAIPTFAVDGSGIASHIRSPQATGTNEALITAAQKSIDAVKQASGSVADKARNLSPEDKVATGVILTEAAIVYGSERKEGASRKKAALKAGTHITKRTVQYQHHKRKTDDRQDLRV
jgi:hypothetical protein